jgi:hypothetical protein
MSGIWLKWSVGICSPLYVFLIKNLILLVRLDSTGGINMDEIETTRMSSKGPVDCDCFWSKCVYLARIRCQIVESWLRL